ncbi:EsaB/YukD family protein [Actinoplanes sp. NPDC051346]|uniref:EsaB/YukD family protein n=1 Tax=Actinoplanes sp. NPDC051346 TaxID=3155048 RepID=UPI00341E0E20
MLDRRSRITVVGADKRVDVAVPSESPIGEYVVGLADLCGRNGSGPMTPAWSLAPAGREPWPIEQSLAEAGVADGQVLYLCDSARDPGTEPVVEDIEELVADDAQKNRGDTAHRGVLTIWLGTGWLSLAAATVALRTPRAGLVAAIGLTLVSLVMLSVAWALNEQRARIPASACLAISLSAAPCLAAAGGLLGQSLDGRLFWCGVVLGAALGTLMALAATPEPAIVAVGVPLVTAGALSVVLMIVHADVTKAAAATTVVALALIAAARPLAGAVAAWSARMPKSSSGMAPVTARLMLSSRRLLTLTLMLPALALVGALPVLAVSGQGWALGLTCVAGLALVIRSRQVGYPVEIAMLGGSGAIGLFSVIGTSAYRYLGMNQAIWSLVLVGGALVGIGVAVAVTYRPEESDADTSVSNGPDRGKFLDSLCVVCLVLSATLAMGVFGVFDELFLMGRTMVG